MRNLQLAPNISNSIQPIIDITDQLPKKASWESLNKKNIVRGKWGGTYHTGFRNPEDIDTIIIHHSGPPNGSLESHAQHHANKWGGGIAYHVAIDKGQIKQTNDLRSFTYHAGGNNTYTVGIVVNRDLSNDDLTDRERELLYAAILSVKAVLPIKHILGHNQVSPTACPVTSTDRIRKEVEALEIKLELEAELANNAQGQLLNAAALHTRVNDLYAKASAPGKFQLEAIKKLSRIADMMRVEGLL